MDLRILNYNTHLFGKNLKSWVADKVALFSGEVAIYRDDERADAVIKAMSNSKLDIVGLTEVWDDTLADRIKTELLGEFPFQYRPDDHDVHPSAVQIGSGLLLLSRHRMQFGQERGYGRGSFVGYKDLAASDASSNKGIAIGQVAVSATRHVLVFLTHNQASYGTGKDAHVEQRTKNVAQLRETIDSYVKIYRKVNGNMDPAGVVVLGDLNIEAEPGGTASTEYRGLVAQMREAGLSDSFRNREPSAKKDPGFTYDATANSLIPLFSNADTKAELQQRLDYQFASAGLAPKAIDVQKPTTTDPRAPNDRGDVSDHYALQITYELG